MNNLALEQIWIGDILVNDGGFRRPVGSELIWKKGIPWPVSCTVKIEGIAGHNANKGEEVQLITNDTLMFVQGAH